MILISAQVTSPENDLRTAANQHRMEVRVLFIDDRLSFLNA